MNIHVKRLSIATLALAASASQGALALEADDFADKVVAVSKIMGISFSYGSATAEGDTVTLSDFTIAVPGEEATEIPGDVVFEGVVETGDGGYTAERASIADIEHTDEDEGITVNLVDIAAEGIVLPADTSVDNIVAASMGLYDRISAGPLTVSDADGTELFGVDLIEVLMDDQGGAEGGITSSYQVSGIHADLTNISEPDAQEMITNFGIEQLSASMSGEGTWWPQTGEAEMSDISFTVDNLGSISMAIAVDGYTEELYTELLKVNMKMAELAEAGEEIEDEQIEEMSKATLDVMADARLVDASLRYDDNSLFMKVLDFVGAEQGVDGETFKAGLQFMVPMALAEVEDAAFKSMVTNAVNTFIADPQNFTISAEPDTPVAFAAFEERADEIEADPFVLVDMLNVQISAND